MKVSVTESIRTATGTAPVEPNTNGDAIRRIILDQSMRAGVGHIGSALSIADIIAALYSKGMRIESPDDPERDRLVLSKGHAALALYAALRLKDWLPTEELDRYCADDSLLGVHPEHALAGVDFSTGSLGQGLSMACGAALAARFQKSDRRVFAILSDAECNEGSVWETVMFTAHHRLSNLTAIVDLNGQQALGPAEEILSLAPMGEKWSAFGWEVFEVDGHDEEQIVASLPPHGHEGPPRVLIAHTVFGKGVSFMERELKWHYLPMSESDYQRAIAELEGRRDRREGARS